MSHHEALLSYLLISPYSFISPIGLSSTCTDEGEGDLQVSSSTAFIPLLVYVFISVIFVLVVLCLQLACIIQFAFLSRPQMGDLIVCGQRRTYV